MEKESWSWDRSPEQLMFHESIVNTNQNNVDCWTVTTVATWSHLQEQDTFGGGFDPRESFSGQIAQFNMFTRLQNLSQISSFFFTIHNYLSSVHPATFSFSNRFPSFSFSALLVFRRLHIFLIFLLCSSPPWYVKYFSSFVLFPLQSRPKSNNKII